MFLFTQQTLWEALFRSWNHQVSEEFTVPQREEDREVLALFRLVGQPEWSFEGTGTLGLVT